MHPRWSDTYTMHGSTLDAAGDITIESFSHNDAKALTRGIAGGVVSVGASVAEAIASGSVSSYVDGDVDQAANLNVFALSANDGDADAIGVAGGIIAGVAGADADVTIAPVVDASVGIGTIQNTGNILIAAIAETEAEADGLGVAGSIIASVGSSTANILIDPDLDASIKGGSVESAGNLTLRTAHNHNRAMTGYLTRQHSTTRSPTRPAGRWSA